MTAVTKTLVPEARRMATTAALFGNHYPFEIESTIFTFADRLASAYHGGYWDFWTLSNGGFLMAPDAGYDVVCPNGFEGHLSAEAMGIVACSYTYSHLSLRVADSGNPGLAAVCSEHFHRLRAFAMDHAEVAAILQATD